MQCDALKKYHYTALFNTPYRLKRKRCDERVVYFSEKKQNDILIDEWSFTSKAKWICIRLMETSHLYNRRHDTNAPFNCAAILNSRRTTELCYECRRRRCWQAVACPFGSCPLHSCNLPSTSCKPKENQSSIPTGWKGDGRNCCSSYHDIAWGRVLQFSIPIFFSHDKCC